MIFREIRKPLRIRAIETLAIALLFVCALFCQSAYAADLSKDEVKSLDGLETRFFEHTYAKEDTENRLDRLEKLVFGEAKQGDQAQRLQDLVASLPKQSELPADPGNAGDQDSGSNTASSAGSDGDGSQQTASSGGGDQDSPAGDAEDYPTVDAIEQVLLGKTFKGQPIAKRLDQLEIKAFKQASTDPDLSERVSKLSDYVQKHMHKDVSQIVDPRNVLHYKSPDDDDNVRAPAYTSNPGGGYGGGSGQYGYGGGQAYGGQNSGSYGMAQPPAQSQYWTPLPATAPDTAQVTWLETHVFGTPTNPNVPLIDRLKLLESVVFPSEPVDPNTPITQQIRVLVNAVELMHTSHPNKDVLAGAAQQTQQSQAQGNGGAAGQNFPTWPPQSPTGAGGNQYSGYSAYASQNQQQASYPFQGQQAGGGYGSDTQMQQQLNQFSQQQDQQQEAQHQQQQQEKHGHPLLKGLAHTLMQVGSMAASSAMMGGMMGGMGGYGYGGYGGMMPGYPMGGMRW